ncbi:MAG TPA: ribosome-binding factor A [bacterium]|jgi:ribosome-binding factor A|nr:ribosome-binding factor A [bacterium]HPO11457.1 ribosome-binding factor A [bacterium]HQL11666.1 ribosome-binding factor A [bacterium]
MIKRKTLVQKPKSFRTKQINELLLRSLSNIIREDIDIPDDIFFTITKVITSKELDIAKVFYITQPEEKHAIVANILKKNKKIINDRVEQDVIIRKLPKFKFIFDKKELSALKLSEKISKLE